MRPRVVRLVDIGADDRFDALLREAMLQTIDARAASPIVEIEFVRSRDELAVGLDLTAPAAVLHGMAHGDHAEGPALSSDDQRTSYSPDQPVEHVFLQGRHIRTSTVFADGCGTAIVV
jgi:hypothetical protein